MDLQHQQVKQLSDWLKQTEERIRKMETEPSAGDLQGYVAQLERHKVRGLGNAHSRPLVVQANRAEA